MIVCSCNALSDREWRHAVRQVVAERAKCPAGQNQAAISSEEKTQQDIDAIWAQLGKEHVCRRCRSGLEGMTREEIDGTPPANLPSTLVNV